MMTIITRLGRLHTQQLDWRTWLRIAWWLLVLPLALACWAAAQHSRPRQILAWTLTGVALFIWAAAAAAGISNPPKDAVRSQVPEPSPAPSLSAPATSVPTPVQTTLTATETPPATTPAIQAPPATTPAIQAPPPPVQPTQPAPIVPPVTPAAQIFANCTAMHMVYPHGVGVPGAVDHVSGSTKPVTTFTRSAALYAANAGSDRDGDQIACEA